MLVLSFLAKQTHWWLRPSQTTPFEVAKDIFGLNAFGPDQIAKVFGSRPSRIPEVPFSERELEEIHRVLRNHVSLVLRFLPLNRVSEAGDVKIDNQVRIHPGQDIIRSPSFRLVTGEMSAYDARALGELAKRHRFGIRVASVATAVTAAVLDRECNTVTLTGPRFVASGFGDRTSLVLTLGSFEGEIAVRRLARSGLPLLSVWEICSAR